MNRANEVRGIVNKNCGAEKGFKGYIMVNSLEKLIRELVESEEKRLKPLREACDTVIEYLDQRMDCDDGIPNEEMNLHTELSQAIKLGV